MLLIVTLLFYILASLSCTWSLTIPSNYHQRDAKFSRPGTLPHTSIPKRSLANMLQQQCTCYCCNLNRVFHRPRFVTTNRNQTMPYGARTTAPFRRFAWLGKHDYLVPATRYNISGSYTLYHVILHYLFCTKRPPRIPRLVFRKTLAQSG